MNYSLFCLIFPLAFNRIRRCFLRPAFRHGTFTVDQYRILSDNVNVLPRNYNILTFSENTHYFPLAVNYYRDKTSVIYIKLHIVTFPILVPFGLHMTPLFLNSAIEQPIQKSSPFFGNFSQYSFCCKNAFYMIKLYL